MELRTASVDDAKNTLLTPLRADATPATRQSQVSARYYLHLHKTLSMCKEMQEVLQRAFRLGVQINEIHLSCECFQIVCASLFTEVERAKSKKEDLVRMGKGAGRGRGFGFGSKQKPERGASSVQAESVQ